MAPRKNTATDEVTVADFETDHSIAAEPKRPVINRKVVKPIKKRTVTMKKTRSPTATKTKARAALSDRTNLQDQQAEDDDDLVAATKKAVKSKTVRKDPTADATKPKAVKKAAPKKREPSPDYMRVIPETQVVQDVTESIEADSEAMAIDEPEPQPSPPRKATHVRSTSIQRQPAPYARARSTSQQPRVFSREGSASLAERRIADSEARRKLADMTSKYEDICLRYESLSELGTTAAESNFDKLKRATDQRAKDAAELISSLKKELAEARKASSSTTAGNAKLHTQMDALREEGEQSRAELADVKKSLVAAQNEVKALNAKLEAQRKAAAVAVEAAKVPGSEIKERDGGRSHLSGNLDSAKQAALKEELYRDLTGLIVNSVRRRDGEDEFSCIQTGKNGTLLFHLTISNDASAPNPKTPSGMSFEETEFAYEPVFDESRDRDLIDILPDYLTEEICFPRAQAVKFYTKVVDSMNKKVEMEE